MPEKFPTGAFHPKAHVHTTESLEFHNISETAGGGGATAPILRHARTPDAPAGLKRNLNSVRGAHPSIYASKRMAQLPGRRIPQGRKRKRSPGRDALANVQATLWESIPLGLALGLSWGFDWVARQVAVSAGAEWSKTTHVALFIVDLVAFVQLVVPKALVILNEIVALGMNILETGAEGLYRVGVAFRGGRADDTE